MDNEKKERCLFLIIIILSIMLGIQIGLHYNKNPSINQSTTQTTQEVKDKINLNTATEKLLNTLPGIGEVKAKSIIEYRNKHGKFTSTNDLQNVKGIGQKTYESIKDKVVVN